MNTWKISGMLIVWWAITIMSRTCEETSKPQTNYYCCLWFRFRMPCWLFPRNTITVREYFWCSWFCEFHSNTRPSFEHRFLHIHVVLIPKVSLNYLNFWLPTLGGIVTMSIQLYSTQKIVEFCANVCQKSLPVMDRLCHPGLILFVSFVL